MRLTPKRAGSNLRALPGVPRWERIVTARPVLATDQPMSYVSDFVNNFFWSNPPGITGNDINFNGSSSDVLHGHDEWDGTAGG